MKRFPFIGVPVQAIPTPFQLTDASQLLELDHQGRLDFIARYFRVRGVDAVIPDLAGILSHLASCLPES